MAWGCQGSDEHFFRVWKYFETRKLKGVEVIEGMFGDGGLIYILMYDGFGLGEGIASMKWDEVGRMPN